MGARLAVLLHDTHTAAGARAARYCSTEARRGSNLKYKVATRSARNKNRATGAGCTALRHTLQPSPEPSVWCSFSEPRRSSIAAARERLLCHHTACQRGCIAASSKSPKRSPARLITGL